MKYEDWIRYEQLRIDQGKRLEWIKLPPSSSQGPCQDDPPANPADDQKVWTMIVQIFNSRRI